MTYVVIWEFEVPAERCDAFERAYGPDGDWVSLFQRSAGFLGTELLRETLDDAVEDEEPPQSRTYFTVDRWVSRDVYVAFSERWADAYAELDDQFLELCNVEVCLGKFELVD